MALSDDRLDELSREMVKGRKSVNWLAAMIEAEVRKDDEALIRQLVAALETCGDGDGYNGPYQYYETVPVEEAVAAARARLEKAP